MLTVVVPVEPSCSVTLIVAPAAPVPEITRSVDTKVPLYWGAVVIVGAVGLTINVTVPSEPEPLSSEVVPSWYLAITLYLNTPALAVLVGLTSPCQLQVIPPGNDLFSLCLTYPELAGSFGSPKVSPTVFVTVNPWIGSICASGLVTNLVPRAA